MTDRRAKPGDAELRPSWRGLMHAHCAWLALGAMLALELLAPSGRARVGAGVYGAGLCCLFTVSGVYHRWPVSPRLRALLRRVDHASIFVFIAASGTPLSLLLLHGPLRVIALALAWGAASAGVVFTVWWIDAPRGIVSGAYVLAGVLAASSLLTLAWHGAWWPLGLELAGASLYLAGAVVYATRRPDPWPASFGFHEVFHTLVVLGAALQLAAALGWVIPAG